MAKPNYSFEKRQRELAKKKKKEEKLRRKATGGSEAPGEQGVANDATGAASTDGGQAAPVDGQTAR